MDAVNETCVRAFKESYGHSPSWMVAAPARVNCLGEHIDYAGYGVLPFALRLKTVVCSSFRVLETSNTIIMHLRNVDTATFGNDTVTVIGLDLLPSHSWVNYVIAAAKTVMEACVSFCGGLEIFLEVYGTVPYGSGLSSSSALSCAACKTFADIFARASKDSSPQFSKKDIAKLAIASERKLGVAGGGMDQTISCLAEEGCPMYVSFVPDLQVTRVPLPKGGAFVVAHSMVASHKAQTAQKNYNFRVCENRLAAAILLGDRTTAHTLREAQEDNRYVGLSCGQMAAVADAKLSHSLYSLMDIARAFSLFTEEEAKGLFTVLCGSWIPTPSDPHVPLFALRNRAVHVYSEAQRVLDFVQVCKDVEICGVSNEEILVRLGELMDQSHASCRDLYECSCAELDLLVDICKQEGAFGARLTGAGWGGCAVAFVRENDVTGFVSRVAKRFYTDRGLVSNDSVLFASKPSSGLTTVELTS